MAFVVATHFQFVPAFSLQAVSHSDICCLLFAPISVKAVDFSASPLHHHLTSYQYMLPASLYNHVHLGEKSTSSATNALHQAARKMHAFRVLCRKRASMGDVGFQRRPRQLGAEIGRKELLASRRQPEPKVEIRFQQLLDCHTNIIAKSPRISSIKTRTAIIFFPYRLRPFFTARKPWSITT